MKRLPLVLAGVGGLLLSGCQTVPESGRTRLTPMFGEDYMHALGAQSFDEATSGFPEVTSGPDYEMVQRLGSRIAAASGRDDYAWEFKLLDAPDTMNAFALPGGKVAIYSGIMSVTRNEAGLATVVGHEVAHATLQHGNERMTLAVLEQSALGAAQIGLGLSEMDAEDQALVMGALGVGAQYGVQLPFSRTHESEADIVGLRYLVRAGYDPHEAPKVWERMAELNPDRPPAFMSTHPDPLARARELREKIPEIVAEERSRG